MDIKEFLETRIKDYTKKVESDYFSLADRVKYSHRLDEVKDLYDLLLDRHAPVYCRNYGGNRYDN